MYKIFLIEDDAAIAHQISRELVCWGFEVSSCQNFQNVEDEFLNGTYELVIIDINLPSYDGFHWCKKIRSYSKVPVIMISARDSSMDQIMAMDLGADDYITKPFDLEVFIAKVKAVLRRNYAYKDEQLNINSYRDLKLDMSRNILIYNDHRIDLTKNEFIILNTLFNHSGTIVKREKIMEILWEGDRFVDDNTLSVNVNRLRKKLSDSGLEDLIFTKKGIGYYVENDS